MAADPKAARGPTGVNARLRDKGIAHAVAIERLKSHEAAKVVGFLDSHVIPDLIDRIEARTARISERGFDLGPETTQRINDLLEVLRSVVDAWTSGLSESLAAQLSEIARYEAEWTVGNINAALPAQVLVSFETALPAVALLQAAIMDNPLDGVLLKDIVERLGAKTSEALAAEIRKGLVGGETIPQIVARARRVTDLTKRSAEAVVRTAVGHASNVARSATYAANADLIKGVQIVETLDTRTCLQCQAQDGKVYPVDSGPRPPFHISCFPGHVLVSAGHRITAVTKRQFHGQVVVIRTASGQQLTCTPNHPILTGSGWVAAGLICEGDDVVRDLGVQWGVVRNDDRQDVPSRIEEVADALFSARSMHAREMPTTAEDFHGDGMEGQVAVVAADRLLHDWDRATLDQQGVQCSLCGGDVGLPQFTGGSHFESVFVAVERAFDRLMSGSGHDLALFGAGFGHAQGHGLTGVAGSDAMGTQHAAYGAGTDAHVAGNCLGSVAGFVSANDRTFIQLHGASILRDDATKAEQADNHLVGNAELARGCCYRVSGVVERGGGVGTDAADIASNGDTSLGQNVADVACAGAEFPAQLLGSHAATVHFRNSSGIETASAPHDLDARRLEASNDDLTRDTDLVRKIIAGLAGPVALDQVVSVECRDFSGHVYNLETEGGYYTAGGVIVHNCRGSTVPVVKSWAELGIPAKELTGQMRASMNGAVSGKITYGDWIKTQPAAVQDEALGPTRAEMLRTGKLEVRDFVDIRGDTITLDQLRKLHPAA